MFQPSTAHRCPTSQRALRDRLRNQCCKRRLPLRRLFHSAPARCTSPLFRWAASHASMRRTAYRRSCTPRSCRGRSASPLRVRLVPNRPRRSHRRYQPLNRIQERSPHTRTGLYLGLFPPCSWCRESRRCCKQRAHIASSAHIPTAARRRYAHSCPHAAPVPYSGTTRPNAQTARAERLRQCPPCRSASCLVARRAELAGRPLARGQILRTREAHRPVWRRSFPRVTDLADPVRRVSPVRTVQAAR